MKKRICRELGDEGNEEKERDRKSPKAPNAPRGKMKKCRGVGADKKKAPRNLTWGFGAFYGVMIFSVIARQKSPTWKIN